MIGINQRIPINILELALISAINDDSSAEYFASLAGTEYKGENRIKKAVTVINRLTIKNPLWSYIYENRERMKVALNNKIDRPVVMAALLCGAYSFGYDTLAISGKYLHAQDEIRTTLIQSKLGEKYGSNRSLPNAFNCIVPMFIEANFIERPYTGILKRKEHKSISDFARDLYHRAFLIHNPNNSADDDVTNHSFFEFIKTN